MFSTHIRTSFACLAYILRHPFHSIAQSRIDQVTLVVISSFKHKKLPAQHFSNSIGSLNIVSNSRAILSIIQCLTISKYHTIYQLSPMSLNTISSTTMSPSIIQVYRECFTFCRCGSALIFQEVFIPVTEEGTWCACLAVADCGSGGLEPGRQAAIPVIKYPSGTLTQSPIIQGTGLPSKFHVKKHVI